MSISLECHTLSTHLSKQAGGAETLSHSVSDTPRSVDVVDDNGDYDDVVDDNGDSDYDADEFETLSHSVSNSPSCYE